jgi:carboxylesterase type B
VWIYGGGFIAGSTQIYDASQIIQQSIAIGEPIIYVAMNYRLAAFGFLSGKEVSDAGATNLGLRDQRKALEWVQENIGEFGGDPDKVTIWVSSLMTLDENQLTFLYRANLPDRGV